MRDSTKKDVVEMGPLRMADDFQWIYWKQLDELLEQDKEDAGQMLHLKQTFRRSHVKDLIQRRKECGAKLQEILKLPSEDSR